MKAKILPLILLTALAACGRQESSEKAASEAPQAESSMAGSEQGPGRDLAAVDVCALIPAEAVAAAAGGENAGPPEQAEPAFGGKGCRYHHRAADGMSRYTEIALYPPEDFAYFRSAQSFELHDLAGLGDGAYWGERTGQTDLYVLVNRDVTVHVQARSQELEQAKAIAATALEHL